MKNQRTLFLSLSLSLALAACAKKEDKAAPVVAEMTQTRTTTEQPAVPGKVATDDAPAQAPRAAIPAGSLVSEVTLNKAAILGKEFNYSSSLQFSSISDSLGGGTPTAMMGLSLGEVPALFNIIDDKLQLLADGKINFESDVNHPARLIYEFPILRQTDTTVTIRVDHASPISDTFMFGNKNKVPVRYSFLRSMEYAEADELMMMESTVELTDGSIGEFMESFRPRAKTVRADVKVIYNDADLNPLAARYDFLDAGDVFVAKPGNPAVRIKTKAAYRWDLSNGEPVKWYVYSAGNSVDPYLDAIKTGVEGWNRYSRAAGKPDLIKFMGKLPEGIKVGDPRYNMIIWDTVQDAGAAYESQNGDPTTGIQSHSMIYIPLAWVNIGKDYWSKFSPENQGASEARAARLNALLKERSFLGRKLPVHCMDAAELHLAAESRQSPEHFALGLLKGVVFHEMGHAFGLGHNFKGSLSYDNEDPSKMFTTSIMDYNDYNEEEAAFESVESANGPLLEYDRQIISVLYNEGNDVRESDPELPACADAVADSTDGGIDPLCNRYDIGADVTKETLKALQLFTVAGSKRGSMEAITAQKITDALRGLPAADTVRTKDDLLAAVAKSQALVAGVTGIYISASANSFGYLASRAIRSLKVFQQDVLPEGYDENEMRGRALQVLQAGANMEEFPEVTKQALAAAKPAVMQYLQSTALVAGLPRDVQQALLDKLSPVLDKLLGVGVQTPILSRMHTRLISELASVPSAPIGFLKGENGQVQDLEPVVMETLEKLSSQKLGAVARPAAERLAALKALKTYKRSDRFQNVADRVVAALKLEIATATDALKRETSRKLLAEFTKADDEE